MGSLFRNHSPATILHDKKDTQAAILVRGALGFHRNGPTMRGRALDCCRNRGRAGTNPETPERPSETGTAALRTGQAITLYFFPAATFIDHPAVSGTSHTPLQRFSGTAFLFRPFFPAVFIVILITNDYI